jgi:hypothetical protein
MKVQYFGDEHDFRKYVLLRSFANRGFRIGVCWMLTPDDGRSDGDKRAYLDQGKRSRWRYFDEPLYDLLAPLVSKGGLDKRALKQPAPEDLKQIEDKGLLKDAVFFEGCVPQSPKDRARFRERCRECLCAADLLFYDPDNGLATESSQKGRKNSAKYLYLDEVTEDFGSGKSVLIYQHFPRRVRHKFIAEKMVQLKDLLPNSIVRAFETTSVVFLLSAQPKHSRALTLVEKDIQALIEGSLFKALHKQK